MSTFIDHSGSDQPPTAAAGRRIEVRFRDGTTAPGDANDFYWRHDGDRSDIMGWRQAPTTFLAASEPDGVDP